MAAFAVREIVAKAHAVGAKVLLVERQQRLGGDCTWLGCVPSKVPRSSKVVPVEFGIGRKP